MFAAFFTSLIVQPIFNLLALIYSLLPGHNLGLAIILFTVAVRMLMWPLIKKQIRNTKITRQLQPELKRIKKEAKGDRSKESLMMMELYKERGINPFGQIGLIFVQMPILIGLYIGLRKIIVDPSNMVSFSYSWMHGFGGLKELVGDISKLDFNFLGIDLRLTPNIAGGGVRVGATIIVLLSAVAQYISARQLMPVDKDAKKLRHILQQSKTGEQPDSGEMNAAVSRMTVFALPIIILLVGMKIAAGLSLYILVGAVVAIIQQSIILREDFDDMEAVASKGSAKVVKRSLEDVVEAEITRVSTPKKVTTKNKTKNYKTKKRRK
jgi:YidC/Oxa1 family membrane protein insertase